MNVHDLKGLVGMLEMGMWENRLVQSLLDTLDSHPEALLPQAIGLVGYAAFLLTKVDRDPVARRILLACLSWCISSGQEKEHGLVLIQNIKSVLKREGADIDTEEIRRRAIARDYGPSESWVLHDPAASAPASPGRERADATAGLRAGIASKLPLTTFRGWLKRLDPGTLNATGRALMSEVFPRFGGDFSRPEQYLQDTERLVSLGVRLPQPALDELAQLRRLLEAGVTVELRRHRRYSGGDGRLPRSCYSSVCSDECGDDGGTLNRELMAYVHPCVPGTVFVGDSSDPRMNEALGNSIGVRPGCCAAYVFLFAPQDAGPRETFGAVYAETLKLGAAPAGPVNLYVLETRVDYVEIDGVIDLRLPETRAWFFNHFRRGDGVHLSKPRGEGISDFCGMLPTLMHPELGGCATTHGVGSWMRTSPVNALIFPSARSDAMVSVRQGQLAGFRGWNMVDYRRAAAIASGEVVVDQDPWYNFDELSRSFNLPARALEQAPEGSPAEGSWAVHGNQARYDAVYQQIAR
jgi:hypothetical protein